MTASPSLIQFPLCAAGTRTRTRLACLHVHEYLRFGDARHYLPSNLLDTKRWPFGNKYFQNEKLFTLWRYEGLAARPSGPKVRKRRYFGQLCACKRLYPYSTGMLARPRAHWANMRHLRQPRPQLQGPGATKESCAVGDKLRGLSQRQMVAELNTLGLRTANGSEWSLIQLQRVIKRARTRLAPPSLANGLLWRLRSLCMDRDVPEIQRTLDAKRQPARSRQVDV